MAAKSGVCLTKILIGLTWHGITVSVVFLRFLERESIKSLQFYCGSLPQTYLLDQRRLLFWNRMMRSDDTVLHSLSCFVRNRTMAVGSAYNINVMLMSDAGVKNAIWPSFASLVYNVLGF